MSGKTHAIVGANAVWLTLLFGVPDAWAPALLLVGAFGGLLPDIDATGAKIHFLGGGLLQVFRGGFRHRAFFHSLLATALLYLVSWLGLARFHTMLPVVLTGGYLSHLVIDGFNFKGTRYLFPWRRELHLVPKFLATPVGGVVDQLLFVLAAAGIVLFLVTQQQVFRLPVDADIFGIGNV